MNYPCRVIQDLLPLYYDGVCSEETREVVTQHLSECASCRLFYQKMCEADEMVVSTPQWNRELQKASSFRSFKKKLMLKQVITTGIALVFLVFVFCSVVGILKNSIQVLPYEDTISASMANGSLIAQLQGNEASHLTVKRVELPEQGITYLFFCLSASKWDALTTSSKAYFAYTLCPAEKGAEDIDCVYYYTGDYTGLESVSTEELQQILDASVLLWRK